MNIWLAAAAVLLIGVVPAGIVALRGARMEQLIALELCGTLAALVMLLLAVGTNRASFSDLAITLALLSAPGCLTFARLLRRDR
jgi:multisubunit Na+/H+ antiporter MnhF subunit